MPILLRAFPLLLFALCLAAAEPPSPAQGRRPAAPVPGLAEMAGIYKDAWIDAINGNPDPWCIRERHLVILPIDATTAFVDLDAGGSNGKCVAVQGIATYRHGVLVYDDRCDDPELRQVIEFRLKRGRIITAVPPGFASGDHAAAAWGCSFAGKEFPLTCRTREHLDEFRSNKSYQDALKAHRANLTKSPPRRPR